MITGEVRQLEGIVELSVLAQPQSFHRIEAVVDTGYNGYLTLPGHIIAGLQLSFAGHRRAKLADGSVILLDVYQAKVEWHGKYREVLVSQSEAAPLIGMAMIQGSRLTMDVVDGGDVTIGALP